MTFDRSTRLLALLLSSALIAGPALAQATPAVPARTTVQASLSEEVRFPSDRGTVLAGTLEKARGFGAGPFPVVVIVNGTGPWKRGGWVNIRARLLGNGIATLMYDKRGQGQSTGTFIDTIPAMERDVAAAVAFLRAHRDIDRRRVALLGASQGAVAAPMVASRDPVIAAVVMLVGPVGPRGKLFLDILRSHLKGAGKTPAQIERVATSVGTWMEARSRSAGVLEVGRQRKAAVAGFAEVGFTSSQAKDFVATLDHDVVLSMFEVAPDRALAKLRAPVLAIYGSKDDVIAPTSSVEAATAALSDNPDALVVAVPGMTHSLTRAVPVKTTGAAPEDRTMPVVTDIVGNWLAKRLKTVAPGR